MSDMTEILGMTDLPEEQRYGHVECRKSEGAHYTPEILSDFIATSILREAKLSAELNVVDPAIGDGELALSLLRKLKQLDGDIKVSLYGFDTNPQSIERSERRIRAEFPELELHLSTQDFLEVCLRKGRSRREPSLFSEDGIPDFDLLIANPPYIRTQVLGAELAQALSKSFGLKGRVDIYQAFIVAMINVLKPNATAGVIVSNRFLTVKGAGQLREKLLDEYTIAGIWDFGDTKLFEAAVLPAVMVMHPKLQPCDVAPRFSSIYESSDSATTKNVTAANPIEALAHEGLLGCENGLTYRVRHGELSFGVDPKGVWSLQDAASKTWLEEVSKNTWCNFGDIGKIRVGVKTTADKVFIQSDWDKEIGYTPELARTLTTHHCAGRFSPIPDAYKSILYTHQIVDGKRKVADLDSFPLSKKYLEDNQETLRARSYIEKAKRKWYEIWVPQNPALWERKKIVFKDISEQPTFWLDDCGTVVNGDCFWMVPESEDTGDEILWLILAVANSKFIEDFYDTKFNNKLYSNRRRFVSQYVELFPLPNPELSTSKKLVKLAKEIYQTEPGKKRQALESKIDFSIYSVFGVTEFNHQD
jgi:adenine-specific DNA-methyltransferase